VLPETVDLVDETLVVNHFLDQQFSSSYMDSCILKILMFEEQFKTLFRDRHSHRVTVRGKCSCLRLHDDGELELLFMEETVDLLSIVDVFDLDGCQESDAVPGRFLQRLELRTIYDLGKNSLELETLSDYWDSVDGVDANDEDGMVLSKLACTN
jgi:hypothetical protein